MDRRLAIRSGSAQARLDAVTSFLTSLAPSEEVALVAASIYSRDISQVTVRTA